MNTLKNTTALFLAADSLKPFNNKTNTKGYSIRTIILLFSILENEGENQMFFSKELAWTRQNVNVHTQTLINDGFALVDDDERDPRGRAKRIVLAEGVRGYITKHFQLNNH